MTTEGIPPFRPGTDGRATARALRVVLGVPTASAAVTALIKRTDPLLHRLVRGSIALRLVVPFASMTTTGARSGQPRTTTVLYFSDGDDVIVIASNYGGTRHPAWYHNLRAHPQVRLARGTCSATYSASEVMDEHQRARLFALADSIYPGYADYRERAARTGRRIPVMCLRLID